MEFPTISAKTFYGSKSQKNRIIRELPDESNDSELGDGDYDIDDPTFEPISDDVSFFTVIRFVFTTVCVDFRKAQGVIMLLKPEKIYIQMMKIMSRKVKKCKNRVMSQPLLQIIRKS